MAKHGHMKSAKIADLRNNLSRYLAYVPLDQQHALAAEREGFHVLGP